MARWVVSGQATVSWSKRSQCPALRVSGTFATPAGGNLRAYAVLTAPEAGVPVLFVEVDNHTEPEALVARKIESYRRFFQRTTKDGVSP
ncbi:replication-relaxation family protein [Streptomyces microflavus]|uniref:replication-relaxation family protein n=1 Tax=Streptomyces microflavus TaxID=1919 RepID=UPI0033BA9C60